jgi:hypothetical protein
VIDISRVEDKRIVEYGWRPVNLTKLFKMIEKLSVSNQNCIELTEY